MGLTLKDVGNKVRIARKSCKMTQRELRDKSGLSLQSIRNTECGRSSANIRTMIKIADALGKRLVVFFDEI